MLDPTVKSQQITAINFDRNYSIIKSMADLGLGQKGSDSKPQGRRSSRQPQTRLPAASPSWYPPLHYMMSPAYAQSPLAPWSSSVSPRAAIRRRSSAHSFMLVLAVMLLLQAAPSSLAHAAGPASKRITDDQRREFKERVQQRLQDHQLNQVQESSQTGQSQDPACTRAMYAYLDNINGPFQQLMWLQSLHGINDAGEAMQNACENLASQAQINQNIKAHRLTLDTSTASSSDRVLLEKENRIQGQPLNASYSLLNFNASSIPVELRMGLCLPSACTQEDLQGLGAKLSTSLTNATQRLLASKWNPHSYVLPDWTEVQVWFRKTQEFADDYWLGVAYQKFGAIAVGLMMSALVIAVIGASIQAKWKHPDYRYRTDNNQRIDQHKKSIAERVSLQQSFSDLLEIRKVNRPGEDAQIADRQDLQMLDCFRWLCLLWILTLGTSQFTMGGSAYNPWALYYYFQTSGYTLVYSANLGFEEFFMLSAFFAYIKITDYLKSKQKNPGTMSVTDFLRIYFGRFLRLAPAYYLVFLIGWLIGPYLATGPWWFTYQMNFCDCYHYWWSVFTMTINEWPGYMVANEGCFYWGWYVASEMQLFLIIPILVYLLEFKLKRHVFAANFLIFAIACGGVIVSFCILYSNEMAAGLFAPQDIFIFYLWLNKAYTKFTSMALGLWLARLFLEVNESKLCGPRHFNEYRQASIFRHKWIALLACAACLAVLGVVSLAPLPANKDPPSWSRLKNATFVSLSRVAYSLALICLFYLLFLDYGRALKRFFARRFWAVLSRLSYGVYLVFPIVAGQFVSSMPAPLQLDNAEMLYYMCYNILASHLVALFVYVFMERPIDQWRRTFAADRKQSRREGYKTDGKVQADSTLDTRY